MKKLLLSGTALFLSMAYANAQGWSATGAHDDFSGTDNIVNGPNGEGLYWFETTSGNTLELSRTGDGTLGITATNAGGCNAGQPNCYPVFGVNFGMIEGTAVTMDLSNNADVVLEIQNLGETFNFITVELEDINGVKASFEPNVSDVPEDATWEDAAQPRKSLNGFTFDVDDNEARTIVLDLTNSGENVGGLSRGDSDCDSGPYYCPETEYNIDITQIKTVIFTVNFGADNIFISEGDGDHTVDRFITGGSITPYTGGYTISDFRIGNFVTSNHSSVDNNKLSIYPNPAKDVINVSYEAANGADITLTDMVGNKVMSTSASAGNTNVSLNTSGLQNGIYILNISTEKGKTSRKVSIQ